MTSTAKPVHPLLAVFPAVFATLAFVWSAGLDGWPRFVLLGVGLVLLLVAIVALTARRMGAPEQGWLPSRDADEPDEHRS